MTASPPPAPGGVLVDVVISLFNKAAHVNRAIRSVAAQTEPRWRLVIVDDGSTDGWAIEDAFDPTRVVVVKQSNAGPGAARNRGAADGSAPFIAFLDADDEWEPEFLATLTSALEADPELAAASSSWSGDRTQTGDQGGALGEIAAGRWDFAPSIAPAAFKARVDTIHSSATIMRRSAFDRFGGFYERGSTYGEDSFMWAALAANRPVFRTEEKLLKFHTDGSSLSVGRQSAYPIPPLLLDWRLFRERVGARWLPFMPQYIAYYARLVLVRSILQGADEQVRNYLRSGALREVGVDRRTIGSIRLAVLRTRMRVFAARVRSAGQVS
ncbi:MAG: glycosyltransferase family A protein [Beijerinckiaceae bacterium]|nr:glycosyltransferase family A protein [Beijerinckiaceae bacterium]